MRFMALLAVVVLLAGCGSGVAVTPSAGTPVPVIDIQPVELTEADDACLDFYRSAQESTIDEAVYMRTFADRIAAFGHNEAAVILDDLANQWAVGVWEGEQDEVWQSGIWAKAGSLLAEAGAVRCQDLAEWWGIEGYEGAPNPDELLRRQAQIWVANQLPEYYMLVAGSRSGGPATQIQARVVSGVVEEVRVPVTGSVVVGDLPTSVEAVYITLLDGDHRVASYDLVHAAPRSIRMTDGDYMVVKVDTLDYPAPIEDGVEEDEGIVEE